MPDLDEAGDHDTDSTIPLQPPSSEARSRVWPSSKATVHSPTLHSLQPHHRLLLEAQRRSAAFHLGEYLDLRRSIWTDLVAGITTAENQSFAGDLDGLVQNVWRFTVNQDQLQSDLTILDQLLSNCVHRGRRRTRWSTLYCSLIGFLLAVERRRAYTRDPMVVKVGLWSVTAACGMNLLYSGIGYLLSLTCKAHVKRLQQSIDNDQVREDDRTRLSGAIWHILQFSNAV